MRHMSHQNYVYPTSIHISSRSLLASTHNNPLRGKPILHYTTPIRLTNTSDFCTVTFFVRKLSIVLSVVTYSNFRSPLFTWSIGNWNLRSMCLAVVKAEDSLCGLYMLGCPSEWWYQTRHQPLPCPVPILPLTFLNQRVSRMHEAKAKNSPPYFFAKQASVAKPAIGCLRQEVAAHLFMTGTLLSPITIEKCNYPTFQHSSTEYESTTSSPFQVLKCMLRSSP